MSRINYRGEGMQRRRDRLAKIKKGPGWFVYTGDAVATEYSPTPLLYGKQVPVLLENGMPAIDGSGRQIFEVAGSAVRDSVGRPMLGGPPKVTRHEIATYKLRGVSFPKGEPVRVDDEDLALKLRCLGKVIFEEVEPVQVEEAEGDELPPEPEPVAEAAPVPLPAVEQPKKRGGRPKKVAAE